MGWFTGSVLLGWTGGFLLRVVGASAVDLTGAGALWMECWSACMSGQRLTSHSRASRLVWILGLSCCTSVAVSISLTWLLFLPCFLLMFRFSLGPPLRLLARRNVSAMQHKVLFPSASPAPEVKDAAKPPEPTAATAPAAAAGPRPSA